MSSDIPDEAVALVAIALRMRAEPSFIHGMKRWLEHNWNHYQDGMAPKPHR